MTAPEQLSEAVRRVLPSARADLEHLVRIPSVSADPGAAPHLARSARDVASLLASAGLAGVDILTVPGGQPAVLGRRPAPPGAPTVLLYAHHDVQPPGDPAAWDSDPFQPTERDGRLYGRGAADDKAGIAVHLAALRAYGDELPVGVIVLVEGEEEIGSPTLEPFLDAYADRLRRRRGGVRRRGELGRRRAVADHHAARRRPASRWSCGRSTMPCTAACTAGPVPDALTALCRLLATLHDERGDVAVRRPGPRHGRSARPDRGAAARRRRPARRGPSSPAPAASPTGCGPLRRSPSSASTRPPVAAASNTLTPVARAKVSLRVAPGDDADRARDALAAHLHAHAPWGAQVTVQPGAAAAPFAAPPGGAAARAAREALAQAWGRPAVDIGAGGTIPFVTAYAARYPGRRDPGHRRRGPRHPRPRRQREPAPADVRARLPSRGPAAALPRTARPEMTLRVLLAAAGSLITLVGVIFALQGVGVIGGSFMSGTTIWAVAGPLIALAGLALLAAALRQAAAITAQHDRPDAASPPFARAGPARPLTVLTSALSPVPHVCRAPSSWIATAPRRTVMIHDNDSRLASREAASGRPSRAPQAIQAPIASPPSKRPQRVAPASGLREQPRQVGAASGPGKWARTAPPEPTGQPAALAATSGYTPDQVVSMRLLEDRGMTIASPAAASLRHADRFFIGGQWVQPSSDSTIQVIDSTNEEVFLSVAEAQAEDMSRAVAAARVAFDQGPWAAPVARRARRVPAGHRRRAARARART